MEGKQRVGAHDDHEPIDTNEARHWILETYGSATPNLLQSAEFTPYIPGLHEHVVPPRVFCEQTPRPPQETNEQFASRLVARMVDVCSSAGQTSPNPR